MAQGMHAAGESEPLIRKPKEQGPVKSLEDALDSPGVGLFHLLLLLIAGCAHVSNSMAVQGVSFVTPLLNDSDANPDQDLRPTYVSVSSGLS